MKGRKNKGFTIVELLGVIAILAIIATIAVVGVSVVLKNMKVNYYKSQADMIVLAAKDFYSANRGQLPKEIGSTEKVEIKDLITQGYLDPVYDYNKKECQMDEGADNNVTVTLSAKGEYHYSVNLSCRGSDMQLNRDKTPPTLDVNAKDAYGNDNKEEGIKVSAKDNESKICSIHYEIRSNNAIYKEGNLLTEAQKEYQGKIDINSYPDGKYTVAVVAVDCDGNSSQKEKNFVVDTLPPTIGTLEYRKQDKAGEVIYARSNKDQGVVWYKTNIWTSIQSIGTDVGSGIDYTSYDIIKDGSLYLKNQKKENILSESGLYEITITTVDKAGNKVSKKEYLNIDNAKIEVSIKEDLGYIFDSEDYHQGTIDSTYEILSNHPSGIKVSCTYQGRAISKIDQITTTGVQNVTCTFTTGSGITKNVEVPIRIIPTSTEFPYNPEDQVYPIYVDGVYQIEGWGARGVASSGTPGRGGYISGTVTLHKGDMVIVKTGNIGGGGSGYLGANGGKSTIVVINGTNALIAAGGGGGNNGGAGGSGTGKGGVSAGYGPGGDGIDGSGGGESTGEKYYNSCIRKETECVGGEDCVSGPCDKKTECAGGEEVCTIVIPSDGSEPYGKDCYIRDEFCYDYWECEPDDCTYDPCHSTQTVCVGEWVNHPGHPGQGGSSFLHEMLTLITKTDGVESNNGHAKITYIRKS